MTEVHYLKRPRLVHQLISRSGKEYTAKCGVVTEDVTDVTAWYQFTTCDSCLNMTRFTHE